MGPFHSFLSYIESYRIRKLDKEFQEKNSNKRVFFFHAINIQLQRKTAKLMHQTEKQF
jgi:hypothetical protein